MNIHQKMQARADLTGRVQHYGFDGKVFRYTARPFDPSPPTSCSPSPQIGLAADGGSMPDQHD
jgi:hypothetical protein